MTTAGARQGPGKRRAPSTCNSASFTAVQVLGEIIDMLQCGVSRSDVEHITASD
jgi:hypothetical protein